ncbi:hypothetical protein [Nostoc sp. JL33]|uniref:hypothetical protein n=1 Tax=Nostoc sp. JL33 TaxID=2815396 RepID=UPI0025F253C8|nr:hypothetical protein [Nostoc sp. JL33]MBN3871173.1 hypothetical protein [Nostoc sp. JL33]
MRQSKVIYQQAEDLLLSELGLKDWQPTEETVAVKSFAESFLSCDRLYSPSGILRQALASPFGRRPRCFTAPRLR